MSSGRKRVPIELVPKGVLKKAEPQSDSLPHVYLSHTVVHTKELERQLLWGSGVRYRCFSFVYLHPEAIYYSQRAAEAYAVNVEAGNGIMMDSGAFSFHMFVVKQRDEEKGKQLQQKTIEQYVEFAKKEQQKWDFAVTFDYKQDQPTIWKVTKELESKGLTVAPVYHGDRGMEWLKRWLDAGYTRIGISTLPKRKKNHELQQAYYDQVFRVAEPYKAKLHGFAVTSLYQTFAWPWHSVDSSSWSRVASLGAIYVIDPERGALMAQHVSETGQISEDTKSVNRLSPMAKKSLRDQVEGYGFDFELLQRSLQYRFVYGAWLFAHFERFRPYVGKAHRQWQTLV